MVFGWLPGLNSRLVRQLGIHVQCPARSDLGRIRMREFGAEQDDLRGVVDPNEQDHDRCRSAVGRLEPLGADVPTDGELAEVEQQCGDHGAW